MKKVISKIKYLLLSLICVLCLAGCGAPTEQDVIDLYATFSEAVESEVAANEANGIVLLEEESKPSDSESDGTEATETSPEAAIDEDGIYDGRDEVALYLHIYGHLPGNYITKKEAQKLGWEGGSLKDYAPDKCIGGDYFGNYEGLLPENDYRECDIGTLGKKSRGAKRIIYSDDGDIYYTEDHYESFEQLY